MEGEFKERAKEILEIATGLFAQHGYEGVSVRDICSRLELNCSTISYYFGGKKGLYISVLKAQFAAYENALDSIIKHSRNPKEELEALCEQSGRIHDMCPHLSLISSRESCNPSPEYIEALKEHESKYNGGHLVNLIKRGQREGYFKSRIDPVYLSRLISMVLNSRVMARATTSFLHPEVIFNDNDYFATIKSILFEGISTEQEDEPKISSNFSNFSRPLRS